MFIKWFHEIGSADVPSVGGKNASLGEMIKTLQEKGIRVPGGFATTSEAYFQFIRSNHIEEQIKKILDNYHARKIGLHQAGKEIRESILNTSFSRELNKEISKAYKELSKKYNQKNCDVAVRSSATAEDLPGASFAGQQETFLHIRGEKDLLEACKKCFASLFTDRAITYREEKGFDHLTIALSIGVQKMVRSDRASAGVLFTLDPETGYRNVVVINGAWGLGENVVQGSINPDEYMVFKPLLKKENLLPIVEKSLGEKEKKLIYPFFGKKLKNKNTSEKEKKRYVLSDEEVLQLAKWGTAIEEHYALPMDIEWAKDGKTKELFIVQARPETIHSTKKRDIFKTYAIKSKSRILAKGLAIGQSITAARAQVIRNVQDIGRFIDGSILVTTMTSPDWVPIMKKASGIITDHGGRTSHAAIVSRELGIPAVVGSGNATSLLRDNQEITLSCAEGDEGFIYEGILEFEVKEINISNLPETKTKIMLNIASPGAAMRWWPLPSKGIGLARMEFIINNIIQIHPMALIHFNRVKDEKTRRKIQSLTAAYAQMQEYFVDHLARGIAKIACSCHPYPTIVRLSDFKTNEYANLIGGIYFEPKEENPMLGFRGASRYYNERYKEGFALECQAIKMAREKIGMRNILVMVPFCRTLEEADQVLKVMEENGLKRGENGLEIYVMAEIPSNIILAEEFAERFDGFSIGSNDLTQLILGVDRDSELLAPLFNEKNEAIKIAIKMLIEKAHKKNTKVGICGEAPSNYPEFAAFLVSLGIDSMSLSPDRVVQTIIDISKLERTQD